MEKEVTVAIIGSVTTAFVAIGGWVFAWLMQRASKARERLSRSTERLRDEIRARMEAEKAANQWLASETGRSEQSVLLEVRKRAEEKSGLRPSMSPSDLVS